MTPDIEFLRSVAASCRKEARAERRRRQREELLQFAAKFEQCAFGYAFQLALAESRRQVALAEPCRQYGGAGNP